MSDIERVEQNQLNRYRVLKQLYDDTNGNPDSYVDIHEHEKKFDFDNSTYDGIIVYLGQENLIKFPAGSYMNITNWGIKEIERAINTPENPTEHFPAKSNTIIIGHMQNSSIQQDTKNSQIQILNQTENEKLTELISKINLVVDQVDLSNDEATDVQGDLDTIKSQSKTSKPKKIIIIESLKSILGVFIKVSAITTSHPEILEAIKFFIKGITGG